MSQSRLKIIFLGNRRIAWEALKMLSLEPYLNAFELCAVVTDSEIWEHLKGIRPKCQSEFISSEERNTEAIRQVIERLGIQVLVSIQYNWILPGDVLDLVNRFAFNLHNARLPEYKGYNSISHAILNGDTVHESTIHWMDDVVDSGDIAYVRGTKILPSDTARSLYVRSVNTAVGAFRALLDDLRTGTPVPRQPMPKGKGQFYPRDSVTKLANVTGISDPGLLSRIARAAFFPPYNTAWFSVGEERFIVLPESDLKQLHSPTRVNAPIF